MIKRLIKRVFFFFFWYLVGLESLNLVLKGHIYRIINWIIINYEGLVVVEDLLAVETFCTLLAIFVFYLAFVRRFLRFFRIKLKLKTEIKLFFFIVYLVYFFLFFKTMG